jgi:adenylosuccinate lyase
MDRQAAYALVQRNAMKVFEQGVDFQTAMLADPELRKHISPDEIKALLSLEPHLKHVDEIFTRVFGL